MTTTTVIDDNFKFITHELNNYNEIYNLNTYLLQIGVSEDIRLSKMNALFKSKVLEMKQKYLSYDRTINKYVLINNLLYLSIVIFGLLFLITGMHIQKPDKFSMGVVITIMVILVIFYLFIVILAVMSNSSRRNQYWNQYYWPAVKKSE